MNHEINLQVYCISEGNMNRLIKNFPFAKHARCNTLYSHSHFSLTYNSVCVSIVPENTSNRSSLPLQTIMCKWRVKSRLGLRAILLPNFYHYSFYFLFLPYLSLSYHLSLLLIYKQFGMILLQHFFSITSRY